jgi:hypothetical protein
MKQINPIQMIRRFMANARTRVGKKANTDQLRVELVPVTDEMISTNQRSQEIRFLVTKMIEIGLKRGRPAKEKQENDNAA